jgi:hypothetical protein
MRGYTHMPSLSISQKVIAASQIDPTYFAIRFLLTPKTSTAIRAHG